MSNFEDFQYENSSFNTSKLHFRKALIYLSAPNVPPTKGIR